jgi:hypothetical protein
VQATNQVVMLRELLAIGGTPPRSDEEPQDGKHEDNKHKVFHSDLQMSIPRIRCFASVFAVVCFSSSS